MRKTTRDERLLFLGMISQADDEGRLLGDPAYLRSTIFPYEDFTLEEVRAMRDHLLEINPNLILYQNSGEEYLYFRQWRRYQKPSHPQPSILPPSPSSFTEPLQEPFREPSQEPNTESLQEQDQNENGGMSSQVRLGKVRLGKVSVAHIPGIDPDLALLGKALEKCAGQLPSGADSEWMVELKEQYPVSLIIGYMEKAVGVTGHWPGWKYIETMLKRGKGKLRDRPGKLPTAEELRKSWGQAAEVSDAIAEEHLREYEKEHPEEFRDSMSP